MINVGKWELDELLVMKKEKERKAIKKVQEKESELNESKKILDYKKQIWQDAINAVDDQKNIMYHEMSTGTTPFKIESRKFFIESLKDVVKQKEKDIEAQKKDVVNKEKEWDKAKKELLEFSKEVNKLKEFREDWVKSETARIMEMEENEMDEIGNLMFQSRQINQGSSDE